MVGVEGAAALLTEFEGNVAAADEAEAAEEAVVDGDGPAAVPPPDFEAVVSTVICFLFHKINMEKLPKKQQQQQFKKMKKKTKKKCLY